MKKSAKLKLLHEMSQSDMTFEAKEEKSDILCSNKVNHDFSSLVYEDYGKTTQQLIYELARLFVDSLYIELEHERNNTNKKSCSLL